MGCFSSGVALQVAVDPFVQAVDPAAEVIPEPCLQPAPQFRVKESPQGYADYDDQPGCDPFGNHRVPTITFPGALSILASSLAALRLIRTE